VKSGQPARARSAFERALAMQADLAEASNDLGALLAQQGDVPAAIERFLSALASAPEYPDALNNLGYALLLTGHEPEARELYKALALQPDFPEAINNLGLSSAGRYGSRRPYSANDLRGVPDTQANNLALCSWPAAGWTSDPRPRRFSLRRRTSRRLRDARHPPASWPLARVAVLERLLQRNPHPVALSSC
jgi:Tfp pilus assembly protein PilF